MPTPSPTSFADQDATQSDGARRTTELLQGRASRLGEPFIATRSMAKRIPTPTGVVIALAARVRIGFGPLALPGAHPVAARLLPAAAFSLLAGPVTAISGPPTPTPGRFPAGRAAVTAQRMRRLERPLTALEQTASPSNSLWDVLKRLRRSATLRWAHGSGNSLTVKSRCEALTSQRGVSSILPRHLLGRPNPPA